MRTVVDMIFYTEAAGQTASAPDPRDRPLDIAAVMFASMLDDDGAFVGMDVAHACPDQHAALPGFYAQG